MLTLFSLTFLFQTSFDGFPPERERGVCANTCSPHQAWLNNFSAILSFWWTENYQLYWFVTNCVCVHVHVCMHVCMYVHVQSGEGGTKRRSETIICDEGKFIFIHTCMTQSRILILWNTNASLILWLKSILGALVQAHYGVYAEQGFLKSISLLRHS